MWKQGFANFIRDFRQSWMTIAAVVFVLGIFIYGNRHKLQDIEHGYCDNGVLYLQKADQNIYAVYDSKGEPVTCRLLGDTK